MTREEAKKVFEYLEKKANTQEPCDAISRDAVLEKAVYTETEEGWCGYTVDVDYIKSLPSVTQKPIECTDAISRDAVMNEVKCWIGSGEYRYTNATDYLSKRIRELPPVTVQQCSLYSISNDGRGLCALLEENPDDTLLAKERQIEALPSAPQKSGKWIELPRAFDTNENPCKCSECGHILSFMNHYPKSNYCPNCGAKMESEE